jgi:4-hydroxythreonine-4-phosphate dehydrogenase
MTSKPPIALTMGDPSGIGPEIMVKMLSIHNMPIKVYGNEEILRFTAKKLKLELPLSKIVNTFDLATNQLNQIRYSTPTKLTGEIAYSAIESAVEDCLKNKSSALVTGPISKVALNLAGYKWPGHTELLAHLSNPRNPPKIRMILLSNKFFIVLNSVHLSLKEAISTLSINSVSETVEIANEWAKKNNIRNPHFWVSGLNPHSGESGLLGAEERDILEPAIKIAKRGGITISGPWPADTVFMKVKKLKTKFPPNNIIISLYHDQALIPFKLDGLDDGVNLTAGLPFLRTSVDHGTAFDIAGRGVASATPLKNAIFITQNLLRNASTYEK